MIEPQRLLALAGAACAGMLPAWVATSGAPPPPVALFDSHAHLMVENLSADQEIALLRQVGLSRILLMTPDPDVLAALAAKYPGVVVPSLSTGRPNAKGLHLAPDTGAIMARAYADHKVCAFGEIAGIFDNNENYRSIYASAAATGAPLVLHIDLATPEMIATVGRIAADYPKMNLVLAHLGWSAGSPVIGRLLDAHSNIYTDVSVRFDAPHPPREGSGAADLSILTADGAIQPDWRAVMERHPDRFLFATDINSFGTRYTLTAGLVATARKALAPLPRPLQDAIGHGNLERLLRGCGGSGGRVANRLGLAGQASA